MATARKKAKQRISYVLPLAESTGGHRLGVNSLCIDQKQSILYSAGRDGSLCAWDLNFALQGPVDNKNDESSGKSAARTQVQAHTHWVNDLALIQNNSAVVSASSDCSVKLWKPYSEEARIPATVGLHTDYVKCLASPGPSLDWIASGGLDHKIRIWDLNAGKQRLEIDALEQEKDNAKGSVYALRIAGGIMASGGPEGVVRVWDYRSGRRITKFVGHTDKLNSILINDLGDTVMTASSDRTIKVWSMAAGRCMHTLTMHNESVWSLWSSHPDLAIFYSTDRSGLIAKTDVRYSPSLDEALSVAVIKEHGGVNKLAIGGDYIWTATASSSINRWRDISTDLDKDTSGLPRSERHGSLATRARGISDAQSARFNPEIPEGIPQASILRTTDAARYTATVSRFHELEGANLKSSVTGRKPSGMFVDLEVEEPGKPVRTKPEETIEGQNGLTRHALLNDRRRVLTVDTAGEIVLMDLIKCVPIQSYGKRHLDDVVNELNGQESIPNWCTLDTRTGRLAVALEENYAFEAEVYADELELGEDLEFNDQQRVLYGKWVLRYLFDGLIKEEVKRDEAYRESLVQNRKASGITRLNVPRLESLPESEISTWPGTGAEEAGAISKASTNGAYTAITPGFGIGIATPAIPLASPPGVPQSPLLTAKTPGTELEKSPSRISTDYFTRGRGVSPNAPVSRSREAEDGTEPATEAGPQSPTSDEKEAKGGFFSRKNFQMKFPKKLGRISSEVQKPTDDRTTDVDKEPSEKGEVVFEESFFGTIQSMRHGYSEQLAADPTAELECSIRLCAPQDAPPLKLPSHIPLVVQEERADSGGVVDLYRGTVGTVGRDADLFEKVAPQWLGDLLLKNVLPQRDPNRAKQPFVLIPLNDALPNMANQEGNSRLTAPRVLRAKKVLEYVAERLNPPENPISPDGPTPEEYLDLFCQDQPVPLVMTLATIRQFIWKSGGDVILSYKSNGKWPAFDKHYGVGAYAQTRVEPIVQAEGHGIVDKVGTEVTIQEG